MWLLFPAIVAVTVHVPLALVTDKVLPTSEQPVDAPALNVTVPAVDPPVVLSAEVVPNVTGLGVAIDYALDLGIEAIHFGQVEIMNHNDRDNTHWARLIGLVRDYASKHARRHIVICNGHVPTGGLMHQGQPLLDFNSFPLRVMELPDKPQEAILKLGFSDGLYNRSKGGKTVNGWSCDQLPYLVELDNYGVSRHPGEPNAKGEFNWVWGYDEITWFAHQPREYRSNWLQYAWDWDGDGVFGE